MSEPRSRPGDRPAAGAGVDPRRSAATAAVAVVAVTVTVLTADTPLMYLWWYLAPGLAVGVVIGSVRRRRPTPRTPWYVLAGALALLWVGWGSSASLGLGLVSGSGAGLVATVRDVLYAVAYPMVGVSGLLMVRARTGGRDRDNVIDALIVMVALATVLSAWLFGTDLAAEVGRLDRTWVTLSPLILAAVVAASARVLFADGHRLPAAWLLFASSLLALLGNLWTVRLLQAGLDTQVTGIDVLWVLAFVAVAAAAAHPSMTELTARVPDSVLGGMPADRLVLFGAALLAGPISQVRLVEDRTGAVAVAVGSAVVTLLAVWRVARLLVERDRARRTLLAVARRDAVVATLGRWALDDRSMSQLLADTDRLLSETLEGMSACAVVPAGSPDPVGTSGVDLERHPVDDGDRVVAEVVAVTGGSVGPLPGDHDFLSSVALLLSAAARRRNAEDQLRHAALHDPLTGLANRTLAVDRVSQLAERRDTHVVTAIFLDLDGFKRVNDTFGHDVGDAVLRRVAEQLAAAVRDEDTVARLAGDEFVVLVGESSREEIERLAARLLGAATTAVPSADGPPVVVGASMGVASAPSEGIDAEQLLGRADAAMYRTKRRGGGGVAWDGAAGEGPFAADGERWDPRQP
ncbi:MAG: GGDEF domain-containing protein [Nitriliruptor sp.]